MSGDKVRRVNIRHSGYLSRAGFVRDNPSGTHMLVPVEAWERVERCNQAVLDWLEREWRALSKMSRMDGHRASSLTILEADLDRAEIGDVEASASTDPQNRRLGGGGDE